MRHLVCAVVIGAALTGGSYASEISTTPQHRLGEEWWKKRFEEKQAQAETGECPMVFMGDSITHGWDGQKAVFDKHFPNLRMVNLGFGGDRTEHTLWVINTLDWTKVNAKALMLMIGTNNTGHRGREQESPNDTFDGIKAIITQLREKTPGTKILLLAIFPRGETAADQGRMRNSTVNAMIPTLADNQHVFFMDIGARFLAADGATLPKDIMPDLLHPNGKGYEIWAEAVKAKLNELLTPTTIGN